MKPFPLPRREEFRNDEQTLIFRRDDREPDSDNRQAIAVFWLEEDGEIYGQTYVTDVGRFVAREEESGRTIRFLN